MAKKANLTVDEGVGFDPLMQPCLDWFDEYTNSFRTGSDQDIESIDVKIDHSRRVYREAVMICQSLPDSFFTAGATRHACLCAALFHDLGRFPQYSRYKTFRDADSVNHGHLSSRIFATEPIDHNLSAQEQVVVRGALALHNRRMVPQALREDVKKVLTLVRDSDKLDIYKVLMGTMRPEAKGNDVVTLGLEDVEDAYSQECHEALMAGRLIEYHGMRFINDFKLLLLSWVNDLNYNATRRAFIERSYIEDVLALLPPSLGRDELQEVLGRRLACESSL